MVERYPATAPSRGVTSTNKDRQFRPPRPPSSGAGARCSLAASADDRLWPATMKQVSLRATVLARTPKSRTSTARSPQCEARLWAKRADYDASCSAIRSIEALRLATLLSLPFIPSALPTTPRFSGTDIKLIWWILQSTTCIWRIPGCIAFGEVVWHFTPEAAVRAAESRFHPTQTLEHEDDGSLIVRFHAAGWLEMAWFLHQWGRRRRFGASETARHDRRLSAIRA